MSSGKEIYSLTGLRFIAAFYVFIFHIHQSWPLTGNAIVKNIFSQGAIGMSLFFILSGFVLAYRYFNEDILISNYFVNRIARVYPVYIVAALVTLPWFGLSYVEGASLGPIKVIAQGIIIVFTNIFMIQARFPQLIYFWNNGASWSISVEAFCYLVFPLIFSRLAKLSTKKFITTFFILYTLAILPGIVGSIFPGLSVTVYYAMPIFRLPEFLIGVCVLLFLKKFKIFKNDWVMQCSQIAFILLFFVYIGYVGHIFPNYTGHNWIAVPLIAFIIYTLSGNKGILVTILANPILVWLGKISYCFYSFQVLVIRVLLIYQKELMKLSPLFSGNHFIFWFALLILLLLSTIGYYYIEEPARKKIRQLYGD